VGNVLAPLEQYCFEEHTGSISYGIIESGMRANLDQLPGVLQRGLARAYLVSGEEFLLVSEAADAIRAAARAAGIADRRVFFVDKGFSWDQLRSDTQSLSLFADRRLFELRIPSGKPDKGAAQLAELATNPPPDVVTLVLTEKLDRKSMDSPWVQAFAQQGVWVQVRSVGEGELPAWLAARARHTGLELDGAAAQLIAERTEGNLLAAHQELAKLALLAQGRRIDAALVLQSVGDSARYDVLQLAEAAAAGDAVRAVHIFYGLKREGIEPTLILWAIVRELRGLWQARERTRLRANSAGSNWSLAGKPSERALSRLRSLPLAALLAQAGEADRIIKGMASGDAFTALLGLVAALAGALQPLRVSGRVA
jgi:DNA polymerase III subunit delta